MSRIALLFVFAACMFVVRTEPVHAQSELEIWCIAQGQVWEGGNCKIGAGNTVSVDSELTIGGYERLVNRGTVNVYSILHNNNYIHNKDDGIINIHGTLDNNIFFSHDDGTTLNNHGTINNGALCLLVTSTTNNYGDINNSGEIQNSGTFTNFDSGIIENHNYFRSYELFYNFGTIYNDGFQLANLDGGYPDIHIGTLYNYGTIHNRTQFLNTNIVENNGTIFNRGRIWNPEYANPVFDNNGIIYNDCTGFFDGLPIDNEHGTIIEYREIDRCRFLPLLIRNM